MGPEETDPTTVAGPAGDRVHRLLDHAADLATMAAPTTTPPDWAQSPDTGGLPGGGDDPFAAAAFGVDPGAFTDAECVAWARAVEEVTRLAQALAIQAAAELDRRVAAGRFTATGAKNTTDLLELTLHLARGDAYRRILLAEELLPRIDGISGAETPTAHPELGTALADGTINTDQAHTVLGFLQEADRLAANGRINPDIPEAIEHDLTTTATTHGPADLRALGQRIMANLDPDGSKPSTADLHAKQGLFFRKPRRGLIGIYGHCTIEQYEHIMATISHATNPNHHKDINTTNNGDNNSDRTNGTGTGTSTSGGGDNNTTDHGTGGGSDSVMDGQGNLLDHLATTTHYLNTPADNSGTDGADSDGSTGTPHDSTETSKGARTGDSTGNGRAPATSTGSGSGSGSQPPGRGTPPATTTGHDPEQDPHQGTGQDPAHDPGPDTGSHDAGFKDPEDDQQDAGPAGGDGFGPGWYGGRLGDDTRPDDDDSAGDGHEPIPPWPHLIDGIPIPEPGSNQELPGLDTTDPTTAPAARDERTHGQKLLDGLVSSLKLASRANTLPVNGGLKSQLIITCSEADLTRTDGTGTAYTTHSGPMPLSLFNTTLCDPDITRLTYGQGQTIINAGRTQRLFTPPSNTNSSTPATSAAPSPAAKPPPPTAKPTTSPPGNTEEKPISTTPPCSAAATTPCSTTANGPSNSSPAPPTTHPHPPSIPPKHPCATPTTTASTTPHHQHPPTPPPTTTTNGKHPPNWATSAEMQTAKNQPPPIHGDGWFIVATAEASQECLLRQDALVHVEGLFNN